MMITVVNLALPTCSCLINIAVDRPAGLTDVPALRFATMHVALSPCSSRRLAQYTCSVHPGCLISVVPLSRCVAGKQSDSGSEDYETLLQLAQQKRQRGNQMMAAQRYKAACDAYTSAVHGLEHAGNSTY
jgi:hypothetical protein